jgi:hypothetical protein
MANFYRKKQDDLKRALGCLTEAHTLLRYTSVVERMEGDPDYAIRVYDNLWSRLDMFIAEVRGEIDAIEPLAVAHEMYEERCARRDEEITKPDLRSAPPKKDESDV